MKKFGLTNLIKITFIFFQLEPYMDEDFLRSSLALMGEDKVVSIKVIKNKFTGEPASYGFINFDCDPSALMAMHKLNGKIIPNSQPVSGCEKISCVRIGKVTH